ncbi:MAG TPA: dodecin family protein [Woeseiaceae bacterium]|jgi:flavin-binding protein dodecin|nr:dodecin family protein [Woeseiaceae bacterium]
MSVARVTEITAASPIGFEDAVRVGLKRAEKTLDNVTGAWIQDQEVVVEDDEIVEYRVHMKATFILND